MYLFYLNGVQFPIAPSKISIHHKSNNTVVNLIDGDVNVLKSPALKEIEFDLLLPRKRYPFSSKIHLDPSIYISALELLKTTKKVSQFMIIRTMPNGSLLFPTNIKCTLEDFTVKEDASEGFDVIVSVKLKQYRKYGLKEVKITEKENIKTASVQNIRTAETAPTNKTHTVKNGDSLFNIAKKNLGDGSRWKEIYELNKDKISNPNLIYPDQILTLPT